ncbi:uncharacterized protein LOC121419852 isoform X2 [Lytechinus variegatus]|uniref:uncharacterized protein LOC121419852 isoform X2 n=1 Tax=Lytechinus variegatus TaxID=7654 RepID=UPI001BB287DC|nr:uncharacterized protein LOC121419852 isoform X2 [Lytechinus variegatus]
MLRLRQVGTLEEELPEYQTHQRRHRPLKIPDSTPATSGVELGQQSVADSNSNTSGQKKSKDIDFKDTLTRVLEASRAESTVKKYKRAV